jgi:hypothetical protein
MAVSTDLARLSVRAKQAEDRAAAAKAQARDQLQEALQAARDSTQQTADTLPAESAGAADRADNIQRSRDDHLARARERIDARKASTPPIARSPTPTTPSRMPPTPSTSPTPRSRRPSTPSSRPSSPGPTPTRRPRLSPPDSEDVGEP